MRFIIAGLAALSTLAPAQAETFEFDLTNVVGREFNVFPESVVDLNTRFSKIDSAHVHIVGEFTPGRKTPVTIPPDSGPILPMDGVNLLIRLGETGTAWMNKPVYAIQDMQGYDGAVEFDLTLRGSAVSSRPMPVLMPSGDLPPDYGFLLDGRFGLAANSMHSVALLYQVLESPEFQLNRFVLKIDGVAVPEPHAWLLLIAAGSSAAFFRVVRGQTRGSRPTKGCLTRIH